MNEHPERRAADTQDHVDGSHGSSHPPHVARVNSAEQPPCLESGVPDEQIHVRVAADHAIERDDVSIGKRACQLDEVSTEEAHAVAMPPPTGLVLRRRDVVGRHVDVERLARARIEQGVMNGANPTADVQEGRARDAGRAKIVDQEPRAVVRPPSPKTLELPARRLAAELRRDTLALTAGHHARLPSAGLSNIARPASGRARTGSAVARPRSLRLPGEAMPSPNVTRYAMLAVRALEQQSRVTTVSAIEATNRSEISSLDTRPVLLVDGDFDSRLICRTTLARAGIEVVTVSDCASSLGVARIVQPKVIILDVETEDDGLEFLATMRDDSSLLDATMIALTDQSAADHERTLAAAGFDRVLTKPIEPSAVVAAVQQSMSQPNRKG